MLFPLLSVVAVVMILEKEKIVSFIRKNLNKAWPERRQKSSRTIIGLGLVSLAGAGIWSALSMIYSSRENIVNDIHRLHLFKCYMGAMFTGHNRFLYGLGFSRTSQTVCLDAGLIIHKEPHAHNVLAQVAGDNGFFALLMLIAIAIILILRAQRLTLFADQSEESTQSFVCSSLSLLLFTSLFLFIEGGWGKISFLQVLVGSSLATLSIPLKELRNGREASNKFLQKNCRD